MSSHMKILLVVAVKAILFYYQKKIFLTIRPKVYTVSAVGMGHTTMERLPCQGVSTARAMLQVQSTVPGPVTPLLGTVPVKTTWRARAVTDASPTLMVLLLLTRLGVRPVTVILQVSGIRSIELE